jgi:hypothetical protein
MAINNGGNSPVRQDAGTFYPGMITGWDIDGYLTTSEAPADGQAYARIGQTLTWIPVAAGSPIGEAPNTAEQPYARDGVTHNWTLAFTQDLADTLYAPITTIGFPEAPPDGRTYTRTGTPPSWTPLPYIIPEAPGDGGIYARDGQLNVWVEVPRLQAPPPGLMPAGGTTGQLLAKLSAAPFDTDWVDPPDLTVYVQRTGDTMSGALAIANNPLVSSLITTGGISIVGSAVVRADAAGSSVVNTKGGNRSAIIAESTLYPEAWIFGNLDYTSMAGDFVIMAMNGALPAFANPPFRVNRISGLATTTGSPTVPLGIATKAYVDSRGYVGPYLPTAGGDMTGDIVFADAPGLAGQITSGLYWDSDIAIYEGLFNDNRPVLYLQIPTGTATDLDSAVYLIDENDNTALMLTERTGVVKTGDVMTGSLSITGTSSRLLIQNIPLPTLGTGTIRLEGGQGNTIQFADPAGMRWQFIESHYDTNQDFVLIRGAFPGTISLIASWDDGHIALRQPSTMTGDPIGPDDLVRKAYVDQGIDDGDLRWVLKTGDDMTGPLSSPGFTVTAQGWPNGYVFLATGGGLYTPPGGGLILRQTSGNQQPQIELNDGTGRFNIVDTRGAPQMLGGFGFYLPGTGANSNNSPLIWYDDTGDQVRIYGGRDIDSDGLGDFVIDLWNQGAWTTVLRTRQSLATPGQGWIELGADPVEPQDAATKNYVDNLVAGALTYQGTWQVAANIPNLITWPAAPGQYFVAVTADPNVPEMADPGIPGIGGTLITNGDALIWSGQFQEWERLSTGSLTREEADTLYVGLAGGTAAQMTGSLSINEDEAQLILNGTDLTTGGRARIDFLTNGGLIWSLMRLLGSENEAFVLRSGRTGVDVWSADQATGLVTVSGDPIGPLDVVTKQYADQIATDADLSYVHKSGDTMTGSLNINLVGVNGGLNVSGVAGTSRVSVYNDIEAGLFVSGDASASIELKAGLTDFQFLAISGIPSLVVGTATMAMLTINQNTGVATFTSVPNTDGGDPVNANDLAQKSYIDSNFVPNVGGTVTGQILSTITPSADNALITKGYVDQLANSSLYQGPWQVAANNPNLNNVPHTNGARYLCVTANPSIPETPPAGIPGLSGRQISDGSFVLWDQALNQWDLIANTSSGLSQAQADLRYLQLTGGTLTGDTRIQSTAPFFRLTNSTGTNRATLAFGSATADHFSIFRNSGATNLSIDRFPADDGVAVNVLGISRSNGVVSYTSAIAMNAGISFGSVVAPSTLDLSRHLALWGGGITGFGLNITANHINIIAATNASASIGFHIGGSATPVAEFTGGALQMRGNFIAGVRDPNSAQDAATKNYVDARIAQAPVYATAQVALTQGQWYVVCTFGQNIAFNVTLTGAWGGRASTVGFAGTWVNASGTGYARFSVYVQNEYGGKFFDRLEVNSSPAYCVRARAAATGTITMGRYGSANGGGLGGTLGQPTSGGTTYGGIDL